MSQLKLTADGGGGTVAIKGPASTTGNAAIELTVPGTGNSTLATTATAGKILQVVQTLKTTNSSTTSQVPTVVDMTGMSVNITPSVANSKIEISYSFNIGAASNTIAFIRLNRKIGSGSFSEIFIGTETPQSTGYYGTNIAYTNDSYMSHVSSCFLDTPSYSVGDVITYKLTYGGHSGNTIEFNGYPGSTNYSTPSNIIAKEVAA